MMEKFVWRTSGHGSSPSRGDEREERNRASFPRWGKLRVISHHFTELVLEITEIGLLMLCKNVKKKYDLDEEGKTNEKNKWKD